jgi:hypothetical protein
VRGVIRYDDVHGWYAVEGRIVAVDS